VSEPPHERQCSADHGQSSSLFGWSRALLPADSQLKRRIDRMVPRTGLPLVVCCASVMCLLIVAPLFPVRGELAVDGVATLAGGGWCAANFWRCRHAHCMITGAGWLALSVFAFVEAGVGRSLINGDEQLAVLAVLVIALAFEAAWYLSRGTNVVGAASHDRRTRTPSGQ
jgi:hypothetical protein